MYLWQVKISTRKVTDPALTRTRYVITAGGSAEEGAFRGRESLYGTDETLQSVKLMGQVPSLVGTTSETKPRIFYVNATYRMPYDPPTQTMSARVIINPMRKIDTGLIKKLEIDGALGPIETNTNEPLDMGKFGIVVGLIQGSPEEAKDLIWSHVFDSQINIDSLNILEMYSISE